MLQRFGPQHGYSIRKIIAEQLSDFTQIKLPTIYYHLEKMEADGLLASSSEKPDSRPEKTVYSVTEKGLAAFRGMLEKLLEFEYRPAFPSDAVFYFSEHLEGAEIASRLEQHILRLEKALATIREHKAATLQFIPEDAKAAARIIFSHHEHHYRAELDWATEALTQLKQEES